MNLVIDVGDDICGRCSNVAQPKAIPQGCEHSLGRLSPDL